MVGSQEAELSRASPGARGQLPGAFPVSDAQGASALPASPPGRPSPGGAAARAHPHAEAPPVLPATQGRGSWAPAHRQGDSGSEGPTAPKVSRPWALITPAHTPQAKTRLPSPTPPHGFEFGFSLDHKIINSMQMIQEV